MLKRQSGEKTPIKPGTVIDRLTIIKRDYSRESIVETSNRKYIYYLCQCECGKIKSIRKDSLCVLKNTRSCGCVCKEWLKALYETRIKLPKGEESLRGLYAHYRCRAFNKKIDFSLTKDEFEELTSSKCFYCGCLPSQVHKHKYNGGDYIYNGLDRLNSSLGYTKDNVKSCCKKCNLAKSDYSLKEFKEWAHRVYNHLWLKISLDTEILELKYDCIIGKTENLRGKRLPFSEAAMRKVYFGYRTRAKRRKINFSLTLEDFRKLSNLQCHYCGKRPSQKAKNYTVNESMYMYNGLDRLNSSLGYCLENVVPCCGQCNIAKSNFSFEEFKEKIKNIYNNLCLK